MLKSTDTTFDQRFLQPTRSQWESDPTKLIVGIEQEHFVFHKFGRVPTLIEMKEFFQALAGKGYRPSSFDSDGLPLSVNKDVGDGYISIKNDFCTHIIEVAFPPLKLANDVIDIYESTWGEIEIELKQLDLLLHKNGSLAKIPANTHLIPNHPRLNWFLERPLPNSNTPTVQRFFTVLMCATQIHLNINDANIFERLPYLYSYEFLIPIFFSNSFEFAGFRAHCVRPIAWRDNLSDDYLANAFPRHIPSSFEEYEKMISGSVYFLRDYSFVCLRKTGSVEFRSGCSQNSIQEILKMTALRMLVASAYTKAISLQSRPLLDDFYKSCFSGRIESNTQFNSIEHLLKNHRPLEKSWRVYADMVLEKIGRI